MSALVKIRSERDRMSAIERRIADFVLENAQLLRDYSSQQLANALGISQSSVVKFCQKLGFKGYPDLKFSVGEALVRADNGNGEVAAESAVLAACSPAAAGSPAAGASAAAAAAADAGWVVGATVSTRSSDVAISGKKNTSRPQSPP